MKLTQYMKQVLDTYWTYDKKILKWRNENFDIHTQYMPTFIIFLFPFISVHIIRSDSLSICIHLIPDNSGPPKHAGYSINIFYWCTTLVLYCATNRKVAGLIPDGVIGIFH
jgi:hypothetical protein